MDNFNTESECNDVFLAIKTLIEYLLENGSTKIFIIEDHIKNNSSKAPIWIKRNMTISKFVKKFPTLFSIDNQIISTKLIEHNDINNIDLSLINDMWFNEVDDFVLTEKKFNKTLHFFELPNDFDIIVTRDEDMCNTWITENIFNVEITKIGLDTETIITGQQEKTSIVQISTGQKNIIIQVNSMAHLPDKFVELLSDKLITKIGVAIGFDVNSLCKWFDLKCVNSVLDLSDLSKLLPEFSTEKQNIGLKTLAATMLDVYLDNKDLCDVKKSDWNADILSKQQINYAIADSFISLLIYEKIMSQLLGVNVSRYIKNITRQINNTPKNTSIPKNNLTRKELQQKEQEKRLASIESKIKKWYRENETTHLELEPMNAFYRRHVHVIVETYNDLVSETQGIDPGKYVKITRN
ncbi:putative 3'-5' exonuclease [Cotonvirus japonicus]|uniref:3'-5' exonuclease n=1 Tax=Cotonvirus japonicus TaxID=2811091 RepID=A0ABM7NSH8_9VIRU|nr:putative 3'-5' exonuclease [Cotonvirus japonicus]BCS83118.1 putative 3'-5' exonuclease [Cotonvirus japonicus]